MINSGEERERFREIVQNVGDTLQYMDKVQYDSKEGNFEDVSCAPFSSCITVTDSDSTAIDCATVQRLINTLPLCSV